MHAGCQEAVSVEMCCPAVPAVPGHPRAAACPRTALAAAHQGSYCRRALARGAHLGAAHELQGQVKLIVWAGLGGGVGG